MSKKIRVLHTFNILNRGGAETLMINIYRNINKDKYEFDFLCENQNKGDYDDEVRKLGGRVFHLRPQKKRPIKNLHEIVLFLRKNGPYDVIHIPNMFYSGVYCVAAKIAGVERIIVHSHSAGDSKKDTFVRKMYKNSMRFLINKFADVRIACSDEASIFLFGETKNVIMLNNGVDLSQYNKLYNCKGYKDEFKIKNERIIAEIARFVPLKNHGFFIKLGNFIKKNGLNYKIILIGDGESRKAFEHDVRNNHLDDIIICVGTRSDVKQLLSLIDVIVMPSFYEGFPISVVEALASGTPCVLSDKIDPEVAVIPELIDFVSLNDDCETWIRAIERLLDKKVDKSKVSEKLAEMGFDIKKTTKRLEHIYDEGEDCV